MTKFESTCETTENFSIERACHSSNYLKNLQEIIQSHPDKTAKNFGLSIIHLLENNHKRVLEYLLEVIKDEPDIGLLHRRIGEIFMYWKEFAKAVDCLEKAVELDEDDLTAKIWLSLSYYKIGETKKAEINLRKLDEYIFFLNTADSNWI